MQTPKTKPPVLGQINEPPVDPALSLSILMSLAGGVSRETLRTTSNKWVGSLSKRIFDIAFASVSAVLLAPVMVAICAAIKLTSQGPILFIQSRVGASGQLFRILKFRSMRVERNHPAQPARLCVFATKSTDQRITSIGRFLRRYKLDELPQLFNIVRGDMSVVGPRPLVPEQNPMVFDCKPGLTSAATFVFCDQEILLERLPDPLTQSVHDNLVNPAKAVVDCEYMLNSGVMNDLLLILYTAAKLCKTSPPFRKSLHSLTRAEQVRDAIRNCLTSQGLLHLADSIQMKEDSALVTPASEMVATSG